jgi:DNA polymerase-3 subunit alpha
MSALLSTNDGDTDKVYTYVSEAKKMKIPVLQPDVNSSFQDFGVIKKEEKNNISKKDEIRFGLRTIKNLGDGISGNISKERKKNGLYKTLEDFLTRNSKHKDLSKKSLEALALSGALDSISDRNLILANISELLEFVKESRDKDETQVSLFSDSSFSELKLNPFENKKIKIKTGMNDELEYILPMTEKQKLFWEKELLGIYITSHPLEKYREKMEKPGKNILSLKKRGITGICQIAGVIDELKEIHTKKGDKMAFAKISDFTDSIEVVIFPRTYKEFSEILKENETYAFKGNLEKKEDGYNLLLDKLKVLE